jgi:hypothetical protein
MKTCSRSVLLSSVVLLAPVTTRASEKDTKSDPERPVRLALAAGIGNAYDVIGAHLEIRPSSSHWAVFAGAGIPLRQGPSGVLGFKVFSRPGAGLVGSLHLRGSRFEDSTVPVMAALSATVGWRFRWTDAFLELGIGPSFSYAQVIAHDEGPHAGVVDHVFGFGSLGPKYVGTPFLPDVALALGYEF